MQIIVCIDRKISFHFACRIWIFNKHFEKNLKIDNFPKENVVTLSINVFENFTNE